jgi:tetrahydromethanopterin S-methyltransferase subunit B
MDVRPLEKENASRLSLAISEKASGEQIVGKIEELADRYDDLSEALDPFYSWLHSFR